MVLTDNEVKLVELVRSLTLDEFLEITKSRDGKPDAYFLIKTQKDKIVIG